MLRRSQRLARHVKSVVGLVAKKLPSHYQNRGKLASHIRSIRAKHKGRGTTPLLDHLRKK